MRAAQFDFLTAVKSLAISEDGKTLKFILDSDSLVEKESILAEIEIEDNRLKTNIAKVLDADNVHAIVGQPFQLDCIQFLALIVYFDDLVNGEYDV